MLETGVEKSWSRLRDQFDVLLVKRATLESPVDVTARR
jgi:hypothetical protein